MSSLCNHCSRQELVTKATLRHLMVWIRSTRNNVIKNFIVSCSNYKYIEPITLKFHQQSHVWMGLHGDHSRHSILGGRKQTCKEFKFKHKYEPSMQTISEPISSWLKVDPRGCLEEYVSLFACLHFITCNHVFMAPRSITLEGPQDIVCHDDVMIWEHFPHHLPFVRGIHRYRWILRTKGQ